MPSVSISILRHALAHEVVCARRRRDARTASGCTAAYRCGRCDRSTSTSSSFCTLDSLDMISLSIAALPSGFSTALSKSNSAFDASVIFCTCGRQAGGGAAAGAEAAPRRAAGRAAAAAAPPSAPDRGRNARSPSPASSNRCASTGCPSTRDAVVQPLFTTLFAACPSSTGRSRSSWDRSRRPGVDPGASRAARSDQANRGHAPGHRTRDVESLFHPFGFGFPKVFFSDPAPSRGSPGAIPARAESVRSFADYSTVNFGRRKEPGRHIRVSFPRLSRQYNAVVKSVIQGPSGAAAIPAASSGSAATPFRSCRLPPPREPALHTQGRPAPWSSSQRNPSGQPRSRDAALLPRLRDERDRRPRRCPTCATA